MLDTTPPGGTASLDDDLPPMRVLFVDDEERVLKGLERVLHGYRRRWSMRFVGDGPAALAAMEAEPAEVVVSDMRMPGMSGGELLARIAQRWPDTIRFILSGHADRAMIGRTIGPAHQFLHKPCEGEVLCQVIRTAWRLRCTLSNHQLRLLAGGVEGLPCLPGTLASLTAQLAGDGGPSDGPGRLAAADPGLAARLLQLVNSSFFGCRRAVADPAEAARLLGPERLRELAAAGAFPALRRPADAWFQPEELWRHSVEVSRLARLVATGLGLPSDQVEAAASAGLLHDAGQLLLASHRPHEHGALARVMRDEGDALQERRLLGATHGEIAAYLLGLWGLPGPLVEAVAWHHEPRRGHGRGLRPLVCVHIADALACEADGRPAQNPLDTGFLVAAGCDGQVEGWRAQAAAGAGRGP